MRLTWPNLLSALRMGLIPLFIIAVLERQPLHALVIFAIAGITDLFDGLIARYWPRQRSVLGAYLDPAADKLLLTAAFIMLCIPGLYPGQQIPIWITVVVISRDVLIVVIALILHLAIGVSRFPPSIWSKWNTVFQISAVIAYLLTGLSSHFDVLAHWLIAAVVTTTVVSALEYGYRFVYRANDVTADYGKTPPSDE